MKPETIQRRAKERAAERLVQKATMIARLERKVAECGWDSIWAELLAEARAPQEATRLMAHYSDPVYDR